MNLQSRFSTKTPETRRETPLKTNHKSRKSEAGFSLVEVVIAGAILSVIALASASFFVNQQKMTNFVEYRAKKIQLQNSISGMFLNSPANCRCLFAGANNFPIGGTPLITGANPTTIGRYQWATPNDGICATATMPQPWITAAGFDDMRTESIRIVDVTGSAASSSYSGFMEMRVRAMKEVNGPALTQFRIPIIINTTPVNASTVAFDSCANETSSAASGLDYSPADNGMLTWQNIALTRTGASGAVPGAPSTFQVATAGGYNCGVITTVTISNPVVTSSTRGVILSAYSQDSGHGSPAARFFTTANRFVGMVGQVGRSGDGRAFGLGGDIYVPLTNRQFRAQGCRTTSSSPNIMLNFAVKAVFN